MWFTTFTIALFTNPWQMPHMGTPASLRVTYLLKSSGFERSPWNKTINTCMLFIYFQSNSHQRLGKGALCMRWMCLVRAVLVPKVCSHCRHWYINVLGKCLLSTWRITSGFDRFLNSWQIWQKYPFWPISFEAYWSKSSNDLTGPATNMTSHKRSTLPRSVRCYSAFLSCCDK